MSLTQEELKEIENFTQAAGTLFTGLIMDESVQGRANANSVISHLYGQGLPLSVKTLTASVVALQYVLFWTAGNEPVVAPSDNRTRAQKAVDGGVNPYVPTHYSDAANGIESSWAKDIRLGKEANAARLAAKAKADQRFRETNQVVQGINGRQDYAASNALNEEARRRHAAEDAAQSGKPVRQTGPRSIPRDETDPNYQVWLRTASADEIKIYLSRKGRSHLMR